MEMLVFPGASVWRGVDEKRPVRASIGLRIAFGDRTKRTLAAGQKRRKVALQDSPDLSKRQTVVFMPKRVTKRPYLPPWLARREFFRCPAKLRGSFTDPQQTKENRVLNHAALPEIRLGQILDILENPLDVVDDILKPPPRLTGRQ
ncbi:MAG: hypothetical protein WDZ83_16595 [Rhizobiaceae bacterium]